MHLQSLMRTPVLIIDQSCSSLSNPAEHRSLHSSCPELQPWLPSLEAAPMLSQRLPFATCRRSAMRMHSCMRSARWCWSLQLRMKFSTNTLHSPPPAAVPPKMPPGRPEEERSSSNNHNLETTPSDLCQVCDTARVGSLCRAVSVCPAC